MPYLKDINGWACGRGLLAGLISCAVMAFVAVPALALPEGRHYEMVSPPYKGGYGVNSIEAVAMEGEAEGDSVAFSSLGVFGGEPNGGGFLPYIARRSAAGWSVGPLAVSPAVATGAITDLAPTLERSLYEGSTGASSADAEFNDFEPEFLMHDISSPGAPFEVFGMPLKRLDGKRFQLAGEAGASADLCHVVFYTSLGNVELEPLLPEAEGNDSVLYELVAGDSVAGCGDEPPSLRLVAVGNGFKPDGEHELIDPQCVPTLGANDTTGGNAFNAVSADGSEIFFTTNANPDPKVECAVNKTTPDNPLVLYVRLNGERTVQLSKPIAADCTSGPCLASTTPQGFATFQGANEAGTRAFFTTTQSLVTGDTNSGNDLYLANIGCPAGEPGCEASKREVTSLVQVSHDANAGEAAEVQGVLTVAPNGGRVYFVARGVLGAGANAEGQSPVKGADNLYVYDAEAGVEGGISFIADLCSGGETSGEARDPRCPQGVHDAASDTDLWRVSTEKQVQTTANGHFLLFSTYAQLVAGDTDTAKDVYRYDAQTGRLDRVSIGEAGYDANGNNNAFNAEIHAIDQNAQQLQDDELPYRAISEDGSRIVFETADPLSPAAVNGLVNAYEWHEASGPGEGTVSLVSMGSDEEAVDHVVITPSGRDIFFLTVQGLVPQDGDGAVDLYDARLGEGFPPAPAPRKPCSGDACQGPLSNPAPLLVPGSVAQAPGENLALVSTTNIKKPTTAKRKPKRPAGKKKKKKGGRRQKSGKAVVRVGEAKRAMGRSGR